MFSREDTKIFKGVAIILMVYHHLFYFPERIGYEVSYETIGQIAGVNVTYWLALIGNVCLAMFLFLGGYGTYLSCEKTDKICSVIKQKTFNLYQIYWKVLIPFAVIFWAKGWLNFALSGRDVFLNLMALKVSFCAEWWFLTPYLLLMICYPPFHLFYRKYRHLKADILILFIIDGLVWEQYHIQENTSLVHFRDDLWYENAKRVMQQMPAFVLGCFFAKYNLLNKLIEVFLKYKISWLIGAEYLILWMVIRCLANDIINYPDKIVVYDSFWMPIMAVMVWGVVRLKYAVWLKQLLRYIGQYSTVIWLTHTLFAYSLCKKLIFYPKYPIFIVAETILICILTAKILDFGYSLIRRPFRGRLH